MSFFGVFAVLITLAAVFGSVALALSLPPTPERGLIVGITYVVFSILVQGLTVAPLARRMPVEVPA